MLCQVARITKGGLRAGVGLWQYFMTVLLFHHDGRRLRERILLRLGNRGRLHLTEQPRALEPPRGTESRWPHLPQRHDPLFPFGVDQAMDWSVVPEKNSIETLASWYRDLVLQCPGPCHSLLEQLPMQYWVEELQKTRYMAEHAAFERAHLQTLALQAQVQQSSQASSGQAFYAMMMQSAVYKVELRKDSPTLAVLDTACTVTVYGEVWGQRFARHLKEQYNLEPTIEATRYEVQGIGEGWLLQVTFCSTSSYGYFFRFAD
eukprot:426856-Amphidinium_carterae.5